MKTKEKKNLVDNTSYAEKHIYFPVMKGINPLGKEQHVTKGEVSRLRERVGRLESQKSHKDSLSHYTVRKLETEVENLRTDLEEGVTELNGRLDVASSGRKKIKWDIEDIEKRIGKLENQAYKGDKDEGI